MNFIKRQIKQLKSKEFRQYLMSTHFWGPVTTWSFPVAAIADTQKHPSIISGKMTMALGVYSMLFCRFAWRVTPRNLLLFGCHFTNVCAQTVQAVRFVHYHHLR